MDLDATPPPHCDQSVLHAPGECRYCDGCPGWQDLRTLWGVAFTGHPPTDRQVPCPSDARRGTGQAHVWGGNRPTEIDPGVAETDGSRLLYHPPRTRPAETGPPLAETSPAETSTGPALGAPAPHRWWPWWRRRR